jgi:hypothetical protein
VLPGPGRAIFTRPVGCDVERYYHVRSSTADCRCHTLPVRCGGGPSLLVLRVGLAVRDCFARSIFAISPCVHRIRRLVLMLPAFGELFAMACFGAGGCFMLVPVLARGFMVRGLNINNKLKLTAT